MKTYIKTICTGFKKYVAIAKINFANKLVYPVDIVSEIIFLTFIFSILFFLYQATAKIAPTSPIEKLSLVQILWIAFFANVFAGERDKGVARALSDEIISGQIAYQLNRPYSYIMFHFAQHVGGRLPSIILGGAVTGLFLHAIVGIPNVSLCAFLLGAAMLCVGIVMSFLMQFCMGLCAFWIGNVDPLRWIYAQIMVVAGGAAIPLAFFPMAVRKVLLLLPFSNVAYGAARIIVGCPHNDLFFYLGLQLFWLVMMLIITKILFRVGVKNVVICGG